MTDPIPETQVSPPSHADLAGDLEALSSETRLKLLSFLTKPHYAEEIAAELGTSRQAATKHLERLEERGFIRAIHGRRARGPVTEFQVVPQRIFMLSLQLSELAKLEPVGGPQVRRVDPTVEIPVGEAPPATAPTPPPPTAHLLVLDSPTSGTLVALEPAKRRWTLGRDEDRDVRLGHDPYVSARHAEIVRSETGFDVVDHFSANGTMLNLARVPRGGRVPLRSGDVLTLGRTRMVLQVPS